MSRPTHLFRMECVVETQASDCPHLFRRQGSEEKADVGHLISYFVLSEDISLDDTGLSGLGDVRHPPREDGISVVGAAVPG